ncbi:MAG: CotH kinase family protein [Thalassotalea sp.]
MTKNSLLSYLFLLNCSLLYGCGGGSGSDTQSVDTDPTPTATDSPLLVNEVVASAINGGNDWIELYAAQGPVDLSTYTISDDNEARTPQALPSIILAQGEYIIIQAIDEEDTPPADGLYVTFKLGSDDAVTLYKNELAVSQLDWAEGEATEGTSFGLLANSTPQTLIPTPGAVNQATGDEIALPIELDAIVNENAELRINEIVAKDSADGDDWIEFYVTGSDVIELANYQISDENNELVTLPAITLLPGEFYRVYATTETRENTPTVNFKLGASDTVSLYLGDDLIDQLSWKKGQALLGNSYGRFPDGSDGTYVLTPSAETANTKAIHGPLVINEILASAIDDGNDWFELYNTGAENIQLANYQVLDSSDDIDPVTLPDVVLTPGEYITIYAVDEDPNDYYVPFKLGKTDELSLLLNNETVDYISWDSSDVEIGFSYGLSANTDSINSYDKDFLTPTPGAVNQLATAFNPEVVRELFINISDENWQDILNNPLDEEYHDASITFNGVTLDSVAIRTKGGSSLRSVSQSTSDRYSFKIDINEYIDGQKFFGLKKFTLQNSFNDPSYMREVIAYDLMREMGVPTPEHAYVNVYINGELFGFYLMVEVIDGEFLENHFANENGDLYKPDGVGSDLQWINANVESYTGINLQTNEDTTDNGAFINFVEQLDNGSTDVVDVDSLLRYMSVSSALSNLDSYHGSLAHNYYLYEQDGVFTLLPWDFNESFGTFAMNCNGVDIRELYIDEPVSGALAERPLVANVFANNNNLTTYHEYLTALVKGPLASDAFAARVNQIASLIREHVENDPSAFYSASNFERNLTATVGSFYGLTEFVNYRVDNITKQLNGTLPSAGDGSGFCSANGTRPGRP